MHHAVIPSVLPPSVSPAPYPLAPPVRPRVTDPVAAVVVAVHCFAAGTCTSGRSPVHPSALLRCLAVRQPSTQGQRQGFAPECGGRRNQRGDPPAPAHSEVGCDETDLNPRTPHPASQPPRPRHVSCPSLACPLGGPAGPALAVGHCCVGVQRGHAGFIFLGSDERPLWTRGATGAAWGGRTSRCPLPPACQEPPSRQSDLPLPRHLRATVLTLPRWRCLCQ